MRAIKRVGMDEKVLVRMKKMLAAHEAEVKQMEADQKQAKKQKEEEDMAAAVPEESEKTDLETTGNPKFSYLRCVKTYHNYSIFSPETNTEASMEVEGDSKKKYKISLRKMKNEENKFPAWMTTKKIRKHKNLMKIKDKRNRKSVRDGKKWKLANSI